MAESSRQQKGVSAPIIPATRAVSSWLSVHFHSRSLPLRGRQKLEETRQEKAFHQRFTSDPHWVSEDLLRRRGSHYAWAKKLSSVSSSISIAFDCSLADRHKELKARVKKAKSMNSEHTALVNQLLREVHTTAKKRPTAFDVCQLKARYFEAPAIFRESVLGQYKKASGGPENTLIRCDGF